MGNRMYPVDKASIPKLREMLKDCRLGKRDEFLFVFMINIPLRINDVLNLKVKDVKHKQFLTITPSKTKRKRKDGSKSKGRQMKYRFNNYLKQRIKEYTKNMNDEDYLFQSQKGHNQHISRQQAWRILKVAAEKIGLDQPFGCHSTRKTYARLFYEKYNDIVYVMEKLGHKDIQTTMMYLHLTEEKDEERINKLALH